MMNARFAHCWVSCLVILCAFAGCSDGRTAGDDDEVDPRSNPDGDFPLPPPAAEDTELSLAWVEEFLRDNDIRTIPQFLAGLPQSVGESFVLMEQSRSRHLASIEYPRIIMYGTNARFLVGVSSHPDDPLVEVAEIALLDSDTGEWHFRSIDFGGDEAAMTEDDSGCVGCHGDPARPIWGNYPDWPGAFGGSDDTLTTAQAQSVLELKASQAPSNRFSTLQFPTERSIEVNLRLYLPSRQYGYANTSFNFELAVAVADGIVRRMKAQPQWNEARYEVLEAHLCGGSIEQQVAAYARVAIEGPNDFQLAGPIAEATGTGYDTFGWRQGSTNLDDIVAFRVLDEVVRTDAGVAAAVAPVEDNRAMLTEYWFEFRGEARRQWLRDDFDLYEFDLRPQELLPPVTDALCAELAAR